MGSVSETHFSSTRKTNDFSHREAQASSAMLRWSDLQTKLDMHTSEILLLLDCCYAAQAARGSRSPIPRNVELLVACGMNTKTPIPGPRSFTSLLIEEMDDALRSDGFVKISTLHKNMASRHSKLLQSALYYPLAREAKESIILRPLPNFSTKTPPTPPEAGSLTIRISLAKLEQLQEIVDWLKLNPPSTISNVRIEQLKSSATTVCRYINDDNSRGQAAVSFSKLPAPSRQDVSSAWATFNQSIARIASYLRMSSSNSETLDEEDLATAYAEELTHNFQPVQSAIERSIMALPELSEKEQLLEATEDPQLADLGLKEMLKLRVLANFAPEDVTMDVEVNLNLSQYETTGLLPKRTIETLSNMLQIGRVLIEARKLDESIDNRVLQASKIRLQNLAVLLQSSTSVDFHTLSCQGFFFEPSRAYGLIFRVPSEARKLPVSLHELLSRKIKGLAKPTLGQRLQIAHKIGKAIMKWHLVNWVHQGIASYNIVFFYNQEEGVDYSRPYLCGFEYARKYSAPSTSRIVEQFELNVYRHPDRQGVPNASHQKEHDLYSYGVLLLELGLWDLVERLFRSEEKNRISPAAMGARIKDAAKKELGHYAGVNYQKATSVCLGGDFGVEQDDKINSQMAKAFETQVLAEIEKGAMAVDQ
jgi:hypothetical protein